VKIPQKPPKIKELTDKLYKTEKGRLVLNELFQQPELVRRGGYLHWDQLQHKPAPEGLTPEYLWLVIKLGRRASAQILPFVDKHQQAFDFTVPDGVQYQLYEIDSYVRKALKTTAAVLDTSQSDVYLVDSLIEEAITSSQLEGASTTRKVAKTMLREQRQPTTVSEQMIFNNYRAMQFIREIKDEDLSVEILLELQRILTEKILAETECGKLRTANDEIHVWDHRDGTLLHTPPSADELKLRLKKICEFANQKEHEQKNFIHPIVKAIILHFMLAYDHPFVDGNGRTARALFYWYLLKKQYWLIEFISISRTIKKAPAKYAKAFLYTETDENDVTYFIIHQLNTILESIDAFYIYLEKQQQEIKQVEEKLAKQQAIYKKLNYRQISLLKHAFKHPAYSYSIEGHRLSHNITYDTARTDLLKLSKLKLLNKEKIGKAFAFIVPADIKTKF